MPKGDLPIVIAGAGPAGSTLAMRLKRQNRPVVLIERYKFPRHKLCGEFISPECLPHFAELGVLDEMLSSGGDRIFETRFFESGGRSISVPSEWFGKGGFALSLSRARMDQILFEAAKRAGAVCLDDHVVTGLLYESGVVSGVKVRGGDGAQSEILASIVIDATGRGRVLSKLADKLSGASKNNKPQFIGFKSHLTDVEMQTGVCEIYGFQGGYAGLSFVEGGEANLCFLARASLLKNHNDAGLIVAKLKAQNARAATTLCRAVNTQEWLAVSVPTFGFNLMPEVEGLYSVGDSSAFIDPFTGSGMLMAMESAEILADYISELGTENKSLKQLYSSSYRQRFKTRLRVSGIFRKVAYNTTLARTAVWALSLSERARANVARRTRSTAASDLP